MGLELSKRILVTGFEPYGGFEINPSAEVALLLKGEEIGNFIIDSLILPVSFRITFETLRKELEAEEIPCIIINLGLMPFASAIQVERVAINVKDYDGVPDNENNMPQDEYIIPGGPVAYFSTLPVRDIVNNIIKNGVPAIVSNSAGTHLCNLTMYNVLHYVARHKRNTKVGFIHLPLLPQQIQKITHKPINTPSLPLDVMIRAIRIAIETTLSTL